MAALSALAFVSGLGSWAGPSQPVAAPCKAVASGFAAASLSSVRPRASASSAAAAAARLGAFTAAVAVAASVVQGRRRRLRQQRALLTRGGATVSCRARPMTAPEGQSTRYDDLYLPLEVETPGDETVVVEVRNIDSIAAVKALIQMELGIDESDQSLTFKDIQLVDEVTIGDMRLKDGDKLTLHVAQSGEVEEEVGAEVPEGKQRITIAVEVSPAKEKRWVFDVDPEQTIGEVKEKVWRKLSATLRRIPATGYNLFLLKTPFREASGEVRYLSRRDEMLDDAHTFEESILEGGEEVLFVSEFFSI